MFRLLSSFKFIKSLTRLCNQRAGIRFSQKIVIITLGLCTFCSEASNPGIPVIVTSKASHITYLPLNKVKLLFIGKSQIINGVLLYSVMLPPDNPVNDIFVKNLMGIYPYQLQKILDRTIFSGDGKKPISVTSQQEMADYILSNPGAIGYLTKQIADKEGLVIIEVIK